MLQIQFKIANLNMLDINFIRENAELVKKATVDKRCDPELVEKVLKRDEERRAFINKVEILRAKRNEITQKFKAQSSNVKPPRQSFAQAIAGG